MLAIAAAQGVRPSLVAPAPSRPRLGSRALPPAVRRGAVISRVSSQRPADFDALLNDFADKFEKSDNKPVIVGYGVAGISALMFAEWLIHLPGLNFLLGFPVQLVGLLVLPYLAVRWAVDKKDAYDDISKAAEEVTAKLPGLKK